MVINNGRIEWHIIVSNDIHQLLIKKQGEFLINGIRKSIGEVTAMAVIEGIDRVKVKDTNTDSKSE